MNKRTISVFLVSFLIIVATTFPAQAGPPGVSAGFANSYALFPNGTVMSWGGNDYGQLGDGTTTARNRAGVVPGLSGVVDIAAANGNCLAVRDNGTVWAWGVNSWGQLGDGTTTEKHSPVRVLNLTGAVAVANGSVFSLALTSNGTVWAWGSNLTGTLGNGTTIDSLTPVQVAISDVKAIAAASDGFALKTDGTVWAWGSNFSGELGDIACPYPGCTTPTRIPNISNVKAIAPGTGFTLALTNDGTVWAWGLNDHGQLGNGTHGLVIEKIPRQIPGLSGVKAIGAGVWHGLALKGDGTVWAWGDNTYNQLGNGTYQQSDVPIKVPGLQNVWGIAAGDFHNIAGKNDGHGMCWGMNDDGQLGGGTAVATDALVTVLTNNGTLQFWSGVMPPILYLLMR